MPEGTKVAVLLENRFIDHEISYYTHRFPEEGINVDLLSRLWGQPRLKFKGLELGMEVEVDKSFEGLSDDAVSEYAAIIVPAGYVADYLRYSEKPGDIAPAVAFIGRLMARKDILKCVICHGLWIFDPIPDAIRGRCVTCHNNIIGSVQNAGGIYVDKDIVRDDDLITARTGAMFAPFARAVIDAIAGMRHAYGGSA